ncbi:MAG: LamG domain-containing protein [Clostridia bacterium]|nr:LamG domain-containing protein [Clostridia bacterium]
MATYQELVTRAETAAASAAQSASNTAADKLTVQGYVDRITGLLNNASTLTTPTITVDPQTGRISVSCSASVGNVASSTIKTNTLLLTEVAGNNLDPAIIKDGETIFGVTGSYQGSGGTGIIDCVKIDQYQKYVPPFTAPSQIIVSGLTTIGDPNDFGVDLSMFNGTYEPTSDTLLESGYNRLYKSTSGEYYLKGFDASTIEFSETPSGWYFVTSPTAYIGYESAGFEGSTITSGTVTINSSSYGSTTCSMTVSTSNYGQNLILSGKLVTSLDESKRHWKLSDSVSNFTTFDFTPSVGKIYIAKGGRVCGNPIDTYTTGYPERAIDDNTILYLPFGSEPLLDRSRYDHQIVVQQFGTTTTPGFPETIDKSSLYTSSELPQGKQLSDFTSVVWSVGGETYAHEGVNELSNPGFLNRYVFQNMSYLQVTPIDNEFAFGSKDFTFEAYIYLDIAKLISYQYREPRIYANSQNPFLGLLAVIDTYDYTDGMVATIQYYDSVSTGVTINDKTWYHIAQVRYGNNFLLFLDGTLVSSKTASELGSSATSSIGGTSAIRIGSGPDWDGWPWVGKMADVRLSNVARYTSDFTPLTRCIYTTAPSQA